MARDKKPEAAPIEEGEVETGQTEDPKIRVLPAGDAAPEPEPEPETALPVVAELTGSEVGEIRVRNDAVDKAQKAAKAAQDEAFHLARLAQYAQEALSNGLTNMVGSRIARKQLDPSQQYRVDLDRGLIVPSQTK